jgi:hypothetical protein
MLACSFEKGHSKRLASGIRRMAAPDLSSALYVHRPVRATSDTHSLVTGVTADKLTMSGKVSRVDLRSACPTRPHSG